MPVDGVHAGQEFGEAFLADGRHHRKADGRIHRVAAADPIPEAEHVPGIDPEFGDPLGIRRDGHEMLGDGVLAQRGDQPAPGGGGIGQRLQCRKRLGGNDEQRGGRIESVEFGEQIGRVDIRDEAGADPGIGIMPQCAMHHIRAEIRTADADIHHGLEAFAGSAPPRTRAHRVGEFTHPPQHLAHLGARVRAIHDDRLALGQAQRDMFDGAVLRGVDVIAAQHRVAVLGDPGLVRQFDQQMQGFPVDTVLAVVDVQVAHLDDQVAATVGILGEEFTQMSTGDGTVVLVQFPPSRRCGDVAAHFREVTSTRSGAQARTTYFRRCCPDGYPVAIIRVSLGSGCGGACGPLERSAI